MEWKHPSIVIMMGHPFTGKTSIAMELAKYLRLCMVISLDEILDTISPPICSSLSVIPPEKAVQLTSQAFDILCRVAEAQVSFGLSVIVDSKLSSRDQLDRLLRLPATRFAVVDCWISSFSMSDWERRFRVNLGENLIKSETNMADRWFRLKSWEDVKELTKSMDFQSLVESTNGVSTLRVNVDQPVRVSHVIQALQMLILSEEDHALDYGKWADFHLGMMKDSKYPDPDLQHCVHPELGKMYKGEKDLVNTVVIERTNEEKPRARFCQNGRHTFAVHEEDGDNEAICRVCEKTILGPAYACSSCRLMTLHKSCAEMDLVNQYFTKENFPVFSRDASYSFPENHACLLCKEARRGFSDECGSCIYESHLKCRLFPTIIGHPAHEHKLQLRVTTMDENNKGLQYTCAACGKAGGHAAFGCHGCDMSYHVECALMPYHVIYSTSLFHYGRLELRFSWPDEGTREYQCEVCSNVMRSEEWFYCSETDQTACHMFCVSAAATLHYDGRMSNGFLVNLRPKNGLGLFFRRRRQ